MKLLIVLMMTGCSVIDMQGELIKDDFGKCHLSTSNKLIFDVPCSNMAHTINHSSNN